MKEIPRRDLARTRASWYRIARNQMRIPRLRIENKTTASRRDWVRVTKPRPRTRYFGSSRNRRRRTVPYPQREVTRHSKVSYNIDVIFLYSLYRCHRIFCNIRAFLASRAIRTSRNTASVPTPISYSMCGACVSRNTRRFKSAYGSRRMGFEPLRMRTAD